MKRDCRREREEYNGVHGNGSIGQGLYAQASDSGRTATAQGRRCCLPLGDRLFCPCVFWCSPFCLGEFQPPERHFHPSGTTRRGRSPSSGCFACRARLPCCFSSPGWYCSCCGWPCPRASCFFCVPGVFRSCSATRPLPGLSSSGRRVRALPPGRLLQEHAPKGRRTRASS
jgi:hypothetical protein